MRVHGSARLSAGCEREHATPDLLPEISAFWMRSFNRGGESVEIISWSTGGLIRSAVNPLANTRKSGSKDHSMFARAFVLGARH